MGLPAGSGGNKGLVGRAVGRGALADALVLGVVGYAALVALTRSLLQAMDYQYHGALVMLVAAGQCLVAVALAFWSRQTAIGLGALVAVLALESARPEVRAWLARGWAWAEGGLAALLEWGRGTPPVLTADLAWAGAILAPLGVATLVLASCARRRDPFWPLVAGGLVPLLEWFSFFDRGLDYLGLYLVLAMAWLAAWRNATAAGRERGAAGGEGPASPPPPASPRRPAPPLRPNLSESLTGLRAAAWVALLTALILVPARGLPSYPTVSPGRVVDWFLDTIPGLGRLRGGLATGPVGFNPDAGNLGGPVSAGTGVAMEVLISRAEVRPGPVLPYAPHQLYLRGTVEHVYTGRGWRTRPHRFAFPTGPLQLRWWQRLGEQLSPFWLDVQMEVRARDFRYPYLFSPWIPVEVEQSGETLATGDIEVTSSRRVDSYIVRARVPLHALDELYQRGEVDPDRWRMYLELPPSVPPEVEELARRVTAPAGSIYEKALALEQYLRRNYPYDTGAPRPARGEDFVADFLFDLRRGYCVHHSTAMAVMLRSLGIPTRWVQGFVVDLESGTWIEVPDAAAHAWVEVFIPGCGWVTFDPTPRYGVPTREYVPAPVSPGPGAGVPGRAGPGPGGFPGRPEPALEEPGAASPSPELPRPAGLPWVAVTAVVALGGAGGRILYRQASLHRQQRLRAGESVGAFVLRQYRLVEQCLALLGLVRRSGQTPREFLRESGPHMEESVRSALARLTAAVEEAAFAPPGTTPPRSWEATAVTDWVRRRMGRWRWIRWLALGPPLP
ncbi:MAG: transglutaminase domain-containing protein [Bacillota bacterium]|nr:transglutaminase domain-containing protein [Bacillota bacterium]